MRKRIILLVSILSLVLATAPFPSATMAQSDNCGTYLNSMAFYQAAEDWVLALIYNHRALASSCANERALLDTRESLRRSLYPDGYRVLSQDVEWESADGTVIHGTMHYPDAAGPFPGIVVVHGAGIQVRLDYIASVERLVPLGYVVLVYDKRGTGDSEGVYRSVGRSNSVEQLNELADDVVGGINLLAEQPLVDEARLGVVGWSQAGWINPLAASKDDRISFMLNVVGPVMTVDAELYYSAYVNIAEDYEALQAQIFGYESRGSFDPVPILQDLEDVSGLWVLGGRDLSISTPLTVANLDAIIEGFGHDYQYIVFENANHSMIDVETNERVDNWPVMIEWLDAANSAVE